MLFRVAVNETSAESKPAENPPMPDQHWLISCYMCWLCIIILIFGSKQQNLFCHAQLRKINKLQLSMVVSSSLKRVLCYVLITASLLHNLTFMLLGGKFTIALLKSKPFIDLIENHLILHKPITGEKSAVKGDKLVRKPEHKAGQRLQTRHRNFQQLCKNSFSLFFIRFRLFFPKTKSRARRGERRKSEKCNA